MCRHYLIMICEERMNQTMLYWFTQQWPVCWLNDAGHSTGQEQSVLCSVSVCEALSCQVGMVTWTNAHVHTWACSKGSQQVLLLQYEHSHQTTPFRSSFLGQLHFKLPQCKKFRYHSSETLNFLSGNKHQQVETHMCKLCTAPEHSITFCSAAWETHPSAWKLIVF